MQYLIVIETTESYFSSDDSIEATCEAINDALPSAFQAHPVSEVSAS